MPQLFESLGLASSGLKERSLERRFLVIYGPYFKVKSLAFLVVVIYLCFCGWGITRHKLATVRRDRGPLGGALGQGDWYQSNNERIENMAASMLSQSKFLCSPYFETCSIYAYIIVTFTFMFYRHRAQVTSGSKPR